MLELLKVAELKGIQTYSKPKRKSKRGWREPESFFRHHLVRSGRQWWSLKAAGFSALLLGHTGLCALAVWTRYQRRADVWDSEHFLNSDMRCHMLGLLYIERVSCGQTGLYTAPARSSSSSLSGRAAVKSPASPAAPVLGVWSSAPGLHQLSSCFRWQASYAVYVPVKMFFTVFFSLRGTTKCVFE